MTTKIEWADHTINPTVGCLKCSPGCENCYAERFATRLARNPQTAAKYAGVVDDAGRWTGKISEPDYSVFERLPKKPKRVFVGSMTDIFFSGISFEDLRILWKQMALLRQHTFMLLTKRPDRMYAFIEDNAYAPLENLWLGVTVCNQAEADAKIPVLLDIPAAKRFVSVEPMLGPVEIGKYLYGSYECALSCGTRMACDEFPQKRCLSCGFEGPDSHETWGNGEFEECPQCHDTADVEEVCPNCGTYMVQGHPDTQYIDWVICGGETGHGARPMHQAWVRGLRDQCKAARVPFFFKSWGEWATPNACGNLDGSNLVAIPTNSRKVLCNGEIMIRVGKKRAGRLLDGVEYSEIPA